MLIQTDSSAKTHAFSFSDERAHHSSRFVQPLLSISGQHLAKGCEQAKALLIGNRF
jgi:hypothetical protein